MTSTGGSTSRNPPGGADGPFSAAGWIADCTAYLRERGLGTIEATAEVQEAWVRRFPRRLKKVQMRGGARRSGAKAYSLYVERPTEGANEADGPFSAAGWIADCTAYLRERGLGTIEATAEVQEVLGPAIPQAAQKGPDARRRPKVGREGVLFVR